MVSIVMAFMVLLSVVNLSVATHLCQGKVVDMKISITGQKPHSCGMEDNHDSSPIGSIFKNKCCANELTSLKVDSNYSPSYFKNLPVFQNEIHFAAALVADMMNSPVFTKTSSYILSPPDILPIHSVDLASICVFRI